MVGGLGFWVQGPEFSLRVPGLGVLPEGQGFGVLSDSMGSGFLSEGPGSGVLPKGPESGVYFIGMSIISRVKL